MFLFPSSAGIKWLLMRLVHQIKKQKNHFSYVMTQSHTAAKLLHMMHHFNLQPSKCYDPAYLNLQSSINYINMTVIFTTMIVRDFALMYVGINTSLTSYFCSFSDD